MKISVVIILFMFLLYVMFYCAYNKVESKHGLLLKGIDTDGKIYFAETSPPMRDWNSGFRDSPYIKPIYLIFRPLDWVYVETHHLWK
jgi:hypothetical protein